MDEEERIGRRDSFVDDCNLARDTKCCASLQKQVSLAHFVLQFAFTKISLGNSNLPTARDLLRQAEATLTKAISAYLECVNEASNVNLKASMMNGWATNCVFLACNCSFFFTRTFPWDHSSQAGPGVKSFEHMRASCLVVADRNEIGYIKGDWTSLKEGLNVMRYKLVTGLYVANYICLAPELLMTGYGQRVLPIWP